MGRRDKTPDGETPAGYERVWLGDFGAIFLPRRPRKEVEAESQRRVDAAAEDLARAELRERQEQKMLAAKKERMRGAKTSKPVRKRTTATPKAGWYRVLPRMREIEQQLGGSRAMAAHSDKELSERLRQTREKLVSMGPDRKFNVPRDWRRGLDRLASEMPHFREPLELVRGSLALTEATGKALRIPPILLLGPAGVGKTYFSHQLAELLGTSHGAIAFDQPTYGGQLRGTDSSWSNTQTGLLFNLVAIGEHANPVILLDEVDKACPGSTQNAIDPLAQLHGALEPESARRIVDISVHVEFDASMVTYIATANSIRGLEAPILSRFEVFTIELPKPADSVDMARGIAEKALDRLGLTGRISIERQAVFLLAHLSPRLLTRAIEKALAAVVLDGRNQVREEDVWSATRVRMNGPLLH